MNNKSIMSRPILRALRAFGLASHFLITPVILISTLLLLKIAETIETRLVAAGIFSLGFASLFLWLLFFRRVRRAALLIFATLCLLGGASLAAAFFLRPTGTPPGGPKRIWIEINSISAAFPTAAWE